VSSLTLALFLALNATGALDDTQLRRLEERLRYLRNLDERRSGPRHLKSHLASVAFPA
jgi:hypothetical protein